MKDEKRTEISAVNMKIPVLDLYKFVFFYSTDGYFRDHSSTSQKGLLIEIRDSESKRAYLNAEVRRCNSLEPLYPESAKNLRRIIYDWMKDSLVNGRNSSPIEVHCDREKENGDRWGLELKQYKRLSPAERKMVEESLNACRKRGQPEIRLTFQKNGNKPAQQEELFFLK